ncbi:MAG: type II toxin-antitoxin system RelE/ParE family toxin [Prevotella sp.]|nr:type II toxin-antitoxin system RelE/ParE family toxin [Prevotella sp.]
MKVIWDPKAKKNRSQVADYIRQKFGARRKILFLQEVREVTKKLRTAPYIGKIDPLFEDRSKTYRSIIVNGLNKIVYFVEDDIIYIAGFWDTRMNDEELAANVE